MRDARRIRTFSGRKHRHDIRVGRETGTGCAQIVGHQHVTTLGGEFARGVGLQVLGLHREAADRLVVAPMPAGPCEDVGIRRELHGDAGTAVLLDLLVGMVRRTEIAHGGGHHRDVRMPEVRAHRVEHLLRGGDAHHIDPIRRVERSRAGDQRHPRAHVARLFGKGVSHLAGGMVRQIPDRIERLPRRSGGDQHMKAVQRQFVKRTACAQQARRRRFDHGRLLHAPLAGVAAGKHAGLRLDDRPTELPAGIEIALRHGVLVHVHIHGGTKDLRALVVGKHRARQLVVGDAARDLRDDVRARRRDDQQVGPFRVGHMIDPQRVGRRHIAVVVPGAEHGGARAGVRQRAERQGSDELLRGGGHRHAHLVALPAPVGSEMACLERGDAAGHSEKNMRHGSCRPSIDVGQDCVKYIPGNSSDRALPEGDGYGGLYSRVLVIDLHAGGQPCIIKNI